MVGVFNEGILITLMNTHFLSGKILEFAFLSYIIFLQLYIKLNFGTLFNISKFF